MCGVVGFVDYVGGAEGRLDGAVVSIATRGPDQRGSLCIRTRLATIGLGHTRLSIVGLGEAGGQPFSSRSGRFVMVFNGEIYNFKSLRDKYLGSMFPLRTQTDTEVLVELWVLFGDRILADLQGMFAFCIYDNLRNEVVLVRDRHGIKPLYVCYSTVGFFFGSTPSAVMSIAGTGFEVNLPIAATYLLFGRYDCEVDTFFKGIERVPAGSLIRIRVATKEVRAHQWYEWGRSGVSESGQVVSPELVRQTVENSVQAHMVADVDVGVLLSGGLDSSVIASCVRKFAGSERVRCFSYISDGGLSEEAWIDQVSSVLDLSVKKIRLSENSLQQDLLALVAAQGEPFGSLSLLAQYCVYREVSRSGFRVVLEGQGGDEVFGGYTGYPDVLIPEVVRHHGLSRAARVLQGFVNQGELSAGRISAQVIRNLLPKTIEFGMRLVADRLGRSEFEWQNFSPALCTATFKKSPRVTRFFSIHEKLNYSRHVYGLPHLLRHGDRNSMAWSVESRVPFVTAEMDKLSCSLGRFDLVNDRGVTKAALREAFSGRLPESVLFRKDKVGFEAPDIALMRRSSEFLLRLICSVRATPLVNQRAVARTLQGLRDGDRSIDAWKLWRYVNYVVWFGIQTRQIAVES